MLAPAARTAASAIGIELSPAMAERAREAAPGADVIVGDAASLPFEDGSFEVVLSGFVIFFMPDPTAVLREWRRVLAPGGRLCMSTWGGADPRWAFERDVRMMFGPRIDRARLAEIMASVGNVERFDEPEKVHDELAAAGLDVAEVAQHELEFVFRDENDWYDWVASHAGRVFLDALPADAHDALRATMRERMELIRDERGFPRRYTAIFSRANA